MEPLLMETEYEKPLVLVVDDDPTNLRILVSKLNREYLARRRQKRDKSTGIHGQTDP